MLASEQTVIWQPQPGPQTALLACPIFEVFYGGARGGGKTDGSIGDWLQHSAEYGEHAIGIFVRRKLTQLREVMARCHQLFSKIGAKWNEQKKTWSMPGGGRLIFVYLERDRDAEEYQGHSYTRVYIEEVTNFPSPDPINKLRATLRSAAGVPVGMRLTGNPGGPGHNWVKARYIDPAPKGYEVITEKFTYNDPHNEEPIEVSLERVFIPSRLSDNRLLMQQDPTYAVRLTESGSAALVKAWLTGDWDIVDGAFFDEWSEDRHVLDTREFERLFNPNIRRFRAFDWGSARPFSCGWYAILDKDYYIEDKLLPRNALVKYREWYGADGPNKGIKMTADLVAMGIKDREKGELIRYGVADPSIGIHNGGPSIREMMAVKGIMWQLGDNKRKPGWEQLRYRLVGEGGPPMIFFCDSCQDTIRTLPVLQHDEKDVEDIDTEAEDHAADETRYAVMSRPWVPRRVPTDTGIKYPKLPNEITINELIRRRTARRLAAEI